MPAASVIIPTFDGLAHLRKCLPALAVQTLADHEVIVVDNGSRDQTVQALTAEFPGVRIIALGENRGFPAACNAGILAAEADVVVLLNNDTLPARDWLERLLQGLQDHPEASFAASLLTTWDDPGVVDAAGDGFSLLRGTGYAIGQGERVEAHKAPRPVFGASAAAAAYRRELFEDVGLLDEDFFLLFEDVDLDLRAQAAGHRCVYIPDAVVAHRRGASTSTWSAQVQSRALRNRIWLAAKSLPPGLWALWWLVGFPRMGALFLVRFAARGHPSAAAGAQRGGIRLYVKELVRAFAGLRAKRREGAATRRLGSIRLAVRLRSGSRASAGSR